MSIREGLMDIWCEGCPQHESLEICSPCKQKVERLIESLKSQGVVQKVEGEFPKYKKSWNSDGEEFIACSIPTTPDDMLMAGYCKVEEL